MPPMRPCARLGDGSREAILDGTFKPRFWARQLLPSILLLNYPQLKDERAKRTHRKAYRAPRGAAASVLFAAQRTTQLGPAVIE